MNNRPVLNNFAGFNPRNIPDISDRKKNKNDVTKESVVINTFIKDPETYYAKTPVQATPLPKEMFEKKDKNNDKWYNNPLVPIIAVPLVILGIGAGLTAVYKKSMVDKYKLDEKLRMPPNGRIITANHDTTIALLSLVQDPTWKNLQAATVVIAASATAFIMKNVVDGTKEVWVKKKFADIKRDKEENLIDIETRSFAGKNQIIRSLMVQKSDELNSYTPSKENQEDISKISFTETIKKLSFSQNESKANNNSKEKDSSNKVIFYSLLSVAALGLTALATKSIFKNLRTVATKVEEKTTEFNNIFKPELEKITERKNLENLLKTSKLSDEAKDIAREEWNKIHEPSMLVDPPKETIPRNGKTGLASFVLADSTSFIYTWLINKTPQTGTLAALMCSAGALGYIGEKTVEGVKEVQVEKANAKTEVELQDRLVQVELNNFYQKKNSYIKPLMDEYKEKVKKPIPQEEVKKLKENVLTEIKSGPPFVYS